MRRKHRIGLVAALWALVVLCLTAVAGVGFAKSSASAGQYQYGKKVTICHKDKVTIRISRSALPAHKAHGDTLGPCSLSAKEKAKAKAKAQAKAAKKAQAKAKADKAEAKVEAKADKAEAKEEAKAEKSKGKSEKKAEKAEAKVDKAEAKVDKAEAKADKAEAKAEADESHESDPGRSGEDHGKGQGGEQPNNSKGKKK